jgi:hypothetical protein
MFVFFLFLVSVSTCVLSTTKLAANYNWKKREKKGGGGGGGSKQESQVPVAFINLKNWVYWNMQCQ